MTDRILNHDVTTQRGTTCVTREISTPARGLDEQHTALLGFFGMGFLLYLIDDIMKYGEPDYY